MHTPLLATGRRLATRLQSRTRQRASGAVRPEAAMRAALLVRGPESCAVYSARMPWAFGPTFSHHLHKTILNLLLNA